MNSRPRLPSPLPAPSNSHFEVRVDACVWALRGLFGSDMDCPDWKQVPADKKLILDLKDLKAINSAGLRGFILWIQARPADHHGFEIHYAAPFVLESLQTIAKHLPKDLAVLSFSLNYHNEEKNEIRSHFFVRGKNGRFEVPREVWVFEQGHDVVFMADHFLPKTLKILGNSVNLYDFEKNPFLLE